MSRREKRLSQKLWISNKILQLIKTKYQLFQTHYRSNNPVKKMIYEKHLNKLTHIKYLAKRQNYENLIKNKRENSRETWSIVSTIIDYKNTKNKSKIPLTMEINNQVYDTNSDIFLNILRDYFASIGSLMSKNVTNQHNSNLEIYTLKAFVKVMFFTKSLRTKLIHVLTISRLTQHQV